jgi:Asp-tRNA(Asn)/Glu-tRNA(Gln) amidotransferase C subunit
MSKTETREAMVNSLQGANEETCACSSSRLHFNSAEKYTVCSCECTWCTLNRYQELNRLQTKEKEAETLGERLDSVLAVIRFLEELSISQDVYEFMSDYDRWDKSVRLYEQWDSLHRALVTSCKCMRKKEDK